MKNSAILFLSLSLVVFASCSKDRIEEEQLNEYSSMNEYLDSKKQEEQLFVIDTSGTGPIIGKEGTKIWGSKEILMFPNGDSVQWPFTVQLVELYNAMDMIYYQMPTVAEGSLLTTRGEIRLRAFKDGQELVLRPSKSVAVDMPSDDPISGLKPFYGSNSGGIVDWISDVSRFSVVPAGNGSFLPSDTSHSGLIDILGWINAGKNYSDGSGFSLTFKSETEDLTNVKMFVYVPESRSLNQVYNSVSANIPSGTGVKIIAMAVDSQGKLFLFEKNMTVTKSEEIEVTLAEISDEALTAKLSGL